MDIEWKAAAARADGVSVNGVPEHRWIAALPVAEASVDGTSARSIAGSDLVVDGPAVLRGAGAELGSIGGETLDPAAVAVPKRFGRRFVLPVCVGLAAAFVAGTGYLAVTEPQAVRDLGRWDATADPAGAAAADPTPTDFGVEDGAVDPFGVVQPALTGVPTRLRIGAIGIDTPLETLHLAKGALSPPKNFAKAGWYADGTAPGDQGPAVIAGHVDSQRGPAVFYRLREIQVGDGIQVVRGGKTVLFTVISAAWYPKKKFPTDQVYGPTPDRQLRLITCGGVFDRHLRSYKDNLVVYAVAG